MPLFQRAPETAEVKLWRERMGAYWPAMSLVKVSGLLEPGAMVEIAGTAMLPAQPEDVR